MGAGSIINILTFQLQTSNSIIKNKETVIYMGDTIAAISTPYGVGGIAVIRISGDSAIETADRVFVSKRPLSKAKSHTIHYGRVIDPEGKTKIDDGIAAVMRAPNSYTGEDTVEISIHGSLVSTRLCLEALFFAGARAAEPGEFTKRAFVNGKLDLSQAEAVADIINAKTDIALKSGIGQLGGSLSERIKEIREGLVYISANLGAAVDYPDDEIEDLEPEVLMPRLKGCIEDIDSLLSSADSGRIIREGLSCVIAGSPNVGKSSVLNLLTGSRRAIVTEIAGTTRDVLEEYIALEAVPLRLIDTAGVRDSSDKVEKIGIEMGKEYILAAELVIVVLDSTRHISKEDKKVLSLCRNKAKIVLLNKTDLPAKIGIEDVKKEVTDTPVIEFSAKTGKGKKELAGKIKEMYNLGRVFADNTAVVTNVRHLNSLKEAKKAVLAACEAVGSGMPTDMCAIDINAAIGALGEIIGLNVTDAVVEKIFSQFCVGK